MTVLEPDQDQIEIFTQALFRHAGTEGFASLRAFYEDDSNKPFRIHSIPMRSGLRSIIDTAVIDARQAAGETRSVVFCPPLAIFNNEKHARESDLTEGLALSVELDTHPHEARARLEELLGAATLVVKSGGQWVHDGKAHDKLHLHWRLAAPARGEELLKLKQARDLAARLVGGDPSNKPVCHPIRWPGSWHRKGKPRLCHIAASDPDREISLDEALVALTAATGNTAGTNNTTGQNTSGNGGNDFELEPNWSASLHAILTGEGYHHSLTVLAAKLIAGGLSNGAAINLLRALMYSSTAPHDARWQERLSYIPRAVATARQKQEETTKPEDIAVHWHGDADLSIELDWLIADLLPEVGIGLLSGQWGLYKTFVALDIAAAVMSGTAFLDHPIDRRGGVLFLVTESANQIPGRLEAVLQDKYPDIGKAPFAFIDRWPQLTSPDTINVLAGTAHKVDKRMHAEFEMPLALIIIDTVVGAAGYAKSGEESDTAVNQILMERLAKLAELTGTFVLGVDHFGKTVETGTRGSSAKEGRAEVVLALLGDRSIEGEVTNSGLAVRKRKFGPTGIRYPFAPRTIELGTDSHGRPTTSLVIDWGQTEKPKPKTNERNGWSKSLTLLRRILMNALATDAASDHQPPTGPMVRAVNLEAVRKEYYRSCMADGPDEKTKQDTRQKAFRRAVNTALERNLVALCNTGETTLIWFARVQDSPAPDAGSNAPQ
jgi:hypothetical protein